MPALIYSGAIQSLILIIFLFRTDRGKKPSNYLLASLLFIIGYYLLVPEILRSGNYTIRFHLMATAFPLLFCIGPVLFLYTKSFSDFNRIPFSSHFHFLPAIVALIILSPFYVKTATEKEAIFNTSKESGLSSMLMYLWLLACFNIVLYLYITHRVLINYNTILKEHLSTLEHYNRTWLKNFIYFNMAIWTVYLVLYILVLLKVDINPTGLSDQVFSALLSLSISFLTYTALTKPELFPGQFISKSVKPSKALLTTDQLQHLKTILEGFMTDNKPYLRSDLTLENLAVSLKMSSKDLSQIIRYGYSVNFYDFINKYRIEEVKKKIGSNHSDHLTLFAIANECGFSSKSTFHETFKRFTGVTPSAYKKSLLKQSQKNINHSID